MLELTKKQMQELADVDLTVGALAGVYVPALESVHRVANAKSASAHIALYRGDVSGLLYIESTYKVFGGKLEGSNGFAGGGLGTRERERLAAARRVTVKEHQRGKVEIIYTTDSGESFAVTNADKHGYVWTVCG